MVKEPIEVRLARIEDGMTRLDERISENHKDVMSTLKPVSRLTASHHVTLTVLKRDRWWLFTLMFGSVSIAGYAILKFLGIDKT